MSSSSVFSRDPVTATQRPKLSQHLGVALKLSSCLRIGRPSTGSALRLEVDTEGKLPAEVAAEIATSIEDRT